jgi:hypothetical protein
MSDVKTKLDNRPISAITAPRPSVRQLCPAFIPISTSWGMTANVGGAASPHGPRQLR